MPWLYEWCKNEMFKDLDETDNKDIPVGHRLVLKEQDPTPWGANEVYRLYQEEGWYRRHEAAPSNRRGAVKFKGSA